MNTKQTKISPNKLKKEKIIAEAAERIGKAKAMVFTDYTGLTHKQLEGLKRIIKKSDAQFAVTKNTLLKLALKQTSILANITRPESQQDSGQAGMTKTGLDGQMGTMFLYGDIVAPLKALAKMIKDLQKPEIRFGIMSREAGSRIAGDVIFLSKEDVIKLATLPSREVLLGQLAAMMMAPIHGLHRSLQWNLQKFVMTLHAVEQKKVS